MTELGNGNQQEASYYSDKRKNSNIRLVNSGQLSFSSST